MTNLIQLSNLDGKDLVKHIWLDQIRTAVYSANMAIKYNPDDSGTCNFDCAMVKKEKKFTYQEIIDMFVECGCFADKYHDGWIRVGQIHGQAEKNTRWNRAFAKSL